MAATATTRVRLNSNFVTRLFDDGQVNFICLQCFLTVEPNDCQTPTETLNHHQLICEGPLIVPPRLSSGESALP
jgi:hypothetical protein